ncbi:hypothetical protein PUNSTDRAFT_133198 [Punctularia strigosozonata HHB-11173 SS5]|uniref:uncharacterized protein n=1 Tax=Punctularia strigosozonata (strain HHB-11173) TaxID=741275 RepID=UPI0004417C1A|nr:uncharacterized protein PUNSTDRAFT_133198 [Punctularia strigosozonata HHB-11173 SS5]EIN09406.1 hypothetical protein PUNSTDRAFT_133198 [Punctularia strigosozonata HHB-11173 SS5]
MAASNDSQGSQRWAYFQDALELAIQRVSHKWTYEDFQACFPLLCEEQPVRAREVYNDVSKYMETIVSRNSKDVLAKYNLKDNLDELHAIITEARARRKAREAGTLTDDDEKDVWRPDLPPRTATVARVVPLLEREKERMLKELAEMEEGNLALQAELQANVTELEKTDDDVNELLAAYDEACARWKAVPADDIASATEDMVLDLSRADVIH